ncbi:MAG: 50S ribosomal protein L25 [Pirellulales bacterium]|nr:50S ribosomal protein L25 [Pirellulales bacterium]
MAEVLNVEIRENRGARANKRLRGEGKIPAILYGHGEANVSLALPAEQFAAALRHHSRMVQLAGGVNESAFIKDLQYDTWGIEVLHVDFTRVSTDERIEVDVTVDLKGTAQGVKDGGVLSHLVHEVQVECLAAAIPDKLFLNVTNLAKGQSLHAREIDLPVGVKLLSDPELIIAQCVEPTADADLTLAAGGAEPEVIGRKAEDKEEADDK